MNTCHIPTIEGSAPCPEVGGADDFGNPSFKNWVQLDTITGDLPRGLHAALAVWAQNAHARTSAATTTPRALAPANVVARLLAASLLERILRLLLLESRISPPYIAVAMDFRCVGQGFLPRRLSPPKQPRCK